MKGKDSDLDDFESADIWFTNDDRRIPVHVEVGIDDFFDPTIKLTEVVVPEVQENKED